MLLPHEPNLLHETEEKERSRSHDIDSTPFSPINITYGLVSGVLGLLLHRELSRGKEDREQLKKEQEEAKKRIEELTEKVNAIQSKLMQDLNAVHVILARQEVSMMGRDQRIQALNERLNK